MAVTTGFPIPTCCTHFMFVKHILFVRKANIIAVKHTSCKPVILQQTTEENNQ